MLWFLSFRRCFRWVAGLVAVTIPAGASAQDSGGAGEERTVVLRIHEDVQLDSRIIRLSDIVTPVGEPPEGWARAAAAAVALLPSDGRRLRVDRQRVSESLRRSGWIEGPLRLVGPEQTAVRFVPRPVQTASPKDPAAVVAPAAFDGEDQTKLAVATMASSATAESTRAPALLPVERNRIVRSIEAAFQQAYAEIVQRYEVSFVETDAALDQLGGMRAVRTLRLVEVPAERAPGEPARLLVVGESDAGEVTATVQVQLTALPQVVVPVTSLDRGTVLSLHDLQVQPIARNQHRNDYVADVKSLVGLELVRSVPAGRPLRYDDASEPRVIERGDHIELRVMAGGVTVSTNAKALAPAAAGEMVMVETDQPRRRLMARAVRSGVAEIVTRPPTVESKSDVH